MKRGRSFLVSEGGFELRLHVGEEPGLDLPSGEVHCCDGDLVDPETSAEIVELEAAVARQTCHEDMLGGDRRPR